MTRARRREAEGRARAPEDVERHAVIQAIAEARAQGDLSENAEYEAAKDKQGFIEGRILEIESKLAAAQIIDPVHAGRGRARGLRLHRRAGRRGQRCTRVTYQIVGDDEADLKLGQDLHQLTDRACADPQGNRRCGRGARRRAGSSTTRSSTSATSDASRPRRLGWAAAAAIVAALWAGVILCHRRCWPLQPRLQSVQPSRCRPAWSGGCLSQEAYLSLLPWSVLLFAFERRAGARRCAGRPADSGRRSAPIILLRDGGAVLHRGRLLCGACP